MRFILIYFVCIINIFANTFISYDRNDFKLEETLHNVVKDATQVSLKPLISESKSLYELAHNEDVKLAVSTETILSGIYQNNPDKLLEYAIVSVLRKEYVYIVVNKNSKYKTIYDLNNANINLGIENNAMDLFSLSLSSNFNVVFNKYYEDNDLALKNMINGNGLNAVMFSDIKSSLLLSKYKESIRLINIPKINDFSNVLINKKDNYNISDLRTVKADKILISKNKFLQENPDLSIDILEGIFKNISYKNTCSEHTNILKSFLYLKSKCKYSKNEKKTGTSKIDKKNILNLQKEINSVEDIHVYTYSLFKNKIFAKLNKQTELQKVDKLIKYYKEEDASKIIIRSYSNTDYAYKGGKKIFKLLKKKGISRGDMILKTFNITMLCKEDDKEECLYKENKITFEFL